MATETDRIQLDLESRFKEDGLTQAIQLYEQLLAAHTKLEARLAKPISFSVHGIEAATRKASALAAQATSKIEVFHDALIKLGDPQTAAKIATGQTSIDQVLARGGRQLGKLKQQADELKDAVARQERFRKINQQELHPAQKAAEIDKASLAKLANLQAAEKIASRDYETAKRRQKELSNAALYSPVGVSTSGAAKEMAAAAQRLDAHKEAVKKTASAAGGAGGGGMGAVTSGAADASRELGLLIHRTNEAGEDLTKLYQRGQGVQELVKSNDTAVRSVDKLAETTARVTAAENDYKVKVAQSRDNLATRLTVNRDSIQSLIAEARALREGGYAYTDAAKKVNGLIATRLAERAGLKAGAAAMDSQTAKMQDALQTQITLQERLGRVRTVASRFDRLEARQMAPLERADLLDKRAAALRREASEMAAVGVQEKEIQRVRQQAASADNDALRLRSAIGDRSDRAAEQLQRQIYLEEKLREVTAARGRFQTALADKSLSATNKADLLERQAAATRHQARELEGLGAAEAKLIGLEREALALEARARAQRTGQDVKDRDRAARSAAASTAAGTFDPTGYLQGDRTTKLKAGGAGGPLREEVENWSKLTGKMQENVQVTKSYDAAGHLLETSIRRTNTELKDLGRTGDFSARSFLHNTFVVASWAASVAAYQAVVGGIQSGIHATEELEQRSAILVAVFSKGTDEAYRLRDGVVALAVANGRSADEAIDAATRFARMGMTRVQVMEAVNIALKAANVAEIGTAEAAGRLSSIMVTFGLSVREAGLVLNELNTISNTYNVTNKDMLDGLARVGNLAKQARMPLEELMGVIATGVGRTGQTGSEFGNAVKAMIVSLSTPAIQDKLKLRFDFDVKDSVGGIKDMSTLLAELYVKYQELGNAEKQELLQKVGQKQQASRIAAILDGYVQTQVLSIRAQRDLNSAERENQQIRATMISQLQSLGTEMQRALLNMASGSQSSVLTNVVQNSVQAVTNLVKLISVMPGVSTAVVAVLALMAYRVMRLAIAMETAAANGNFFTNTMRQMGATMNIVAVSVNRANREMRMSGGLSGAFAGGMGRAAIAVMRLTRGLPILAGIGTMIARLIKLSTFAVGTLGSLLGGIAGFFVVEGIFWGINKAVDYFSKSTGEADKAFAALIERSDEAGKLASAFEQSARLYETVGKASASPFFTEGQGKSAARGIAETAFPKDAQRQQQLRAELEILFKQKDVAAIQARLEELRATALREAATQRQTELEKNQAAIALEEKQLAVVRKRIDARNAAGSDVTKDREREKELTDDLDRRKEKRNESYVVPDTGSEGPNKREKIVEAYGAGRIAALDKFSSKLAQPFTETASIRTEINLLNAKKQLYADNAAAIQGEADTTQKASREKVKALQEERDKLAETKKADDEKRAAAKKFDAIGEALRYGNSRTAALTPYGPERDIDKRRRQAEAQGWTPRTAARFARESRSGIQMGGIAAQKGIDNLDRRIAGENQIIGVMQHEATISQDLARAEQTKLDLKIREAEAQLRLAQATDTAARAARNAKADQARYGIGRTESEKLLYQSRALINQSIPAAQGRMLGDEFAAAAPNTKNKDQYRLDVIAQQATIQEHLLTLQQNEAALLQRRAQLEADIANEKQKQALEASKNLLLASREEQLQAALAARFAQKRGGGFSVSDFQFLSQGTRQNIEKFNPQLGPNELNNPLRELQRESAIVNSAFDRLSKSVAEVVAKFDSLNPQKAAADFAGAAAKAETKPPAWDHGINGPPPLNIALGGINIQFSEQMGALIEEFKATAISGMRQYVDPQIVELRNMIRDLRTAPFSNAFARE